MHDLSPAATSMSALITAVPDEALAQPTPCREYTLGDLIEHVGGLALAFTAAATKDRLPGGSQPPAGNAARLEDGWRDRISSDLSLLAAAWADAEAWTGMTEAGQVALPAEIAGVVALNELVVHGWDVARSSGLDFRPAEKDVQVCRDFVAQFSGPGHEADRPPIYGAEVAVPAGAPLLDHLIGMTGRDPHWG